MAELEVHDVGEPKEDDRLLNNRTPFLYYQGYDESNAVNKEQIPGWQGQNSKIVIGKPGLLHSEVERAFLNGRTVDEVHAVAPWKGAIYSEPGLKKAPYYMFFGRDDRMPPDVEQEFARRGYVPKGTDPFKFGSDSEWTFSEPNVTIHEPTGGIEGEGRVPYLWYYHPFDWNDQHVYLGAPDSYHDEIMTTRNPYVPDREWDAMHPQGGALMDDYEFGGTGAVRDNRVYDLGNGRGYLADDFEPVGYDPYDDKPEPVNSPPPTHVLNAVQQHFGPPQGEQEIPKFGSIIDRSPYVDEILEHINGIVPPEQEPLSPHHAGVTIMPDDVSHEGVEGIGHHFNERLPWIRSESGRFYVGPPGSEHKYIEDHPDDVFLSDPPEAYGSAMVGPSFPGFPHGAVRAFGEYYQTPEQMETLINGLKEHYPDVPWHHYRDRQISFGKRLKRLFLRDRVDHHDDGNADNSVTQHCAQNVVYRNSKKEDGEAQKPNDDSSKEIWNFHANDDSSRSKVARPVTDDCHRTKGYG